MFIQPDHTYRDIQEKSFQQWLDENYDDETLYKIYPKAKKPKKVDKSENITYSNTRNDAAL